MLASSSSAIAALVDGPRRPARVLGGSGAALYFDAGESAIAVLTAAAVRLPCAVVVAGLDSLQAVRPDGPVMIGAGALSWTTGGRPVTVAVVRTWSPAHVRPVVALPANLATLRAAVATIDIGVPAELAGPGLIGLGPGLTPSGDDVLAGYVLGCRARGRPEVPFDVADLVRTTALSATLLRHAISGECVPQVAALVQALGRAEPVDPGPLLALGHTSGAALGHGLLLAFGAASADRRLAA